MRWLLLSLLLGFGPAAAEDRAGEFDYYVLALSWQPTWCALEGGGSAQCATAAGWTLHGLWPQYERGWPSDCRAKTRDPSSAETVDIADIMGSSQLAKYQWRKHGRCSGLAPDSYFAKARAAYENVVRPEVFRRLDEAVRLPAAVVEDAFLRDNPRISGEGLTVTCRDGHVQEVRICLTRALAPRACGHDIRQDCALDQARMLPIAGAGAAAR